VRGFSLTELIIALTIALALISIGLPLFSESRKSAAFAAFANEITAQLTMARQHAIHTGISVEIEFPESGPYLFKGHSGGILLSSKLKKSSQGVQVPTLGLAGQALLHPTSDQPITQAMRSTHGRRIIFGRKGSSNATLVFQSGPQRILCLVISGTTGRNRAYIFHQGEWLDY